MRIVLHNCQRNYAFNRVEQAWDRGNIVALLLMDVKGAFDRVSRNSLLGDEDERSIHASKAPMIIYIFYGELSTVGKAS